MKNAHTEDRELDSAARGIGLLTGQPYGNALNAARSEREVARNPLPSPIRTDAERDRWASHIAATRFIPYASAVAYVREIVEPAQKAANRPQDAGLTKRLAVVRPITKTVASAPRKPPAFVTKATPQVPSRNGGVLQFMTGARTAVKAAVSSLIPLKDDGSLGWATAFLIRYAAKNDAQVHPLSKDAYRALDLIRADSTRRWGNLGAPAQFLIAFRVRNIGAMENLAAEIKQGPEGPEAA